MSNVAIITARGGSKRIPKKNIKEFCGQPIIVYSIKAAIESGMFDEVMVSTDDKEIAEIAMSFGASVPFLRSEGTSNDHATTADVIREVIDEYRLRGKEFEYFCCIYPTAPFVTPERLREAIRQLSESNADSLLPVVRFSFPPQRCLIIENGRTRMKWPENLNTRSQDLEPFYHDCGQYYCMRTRAFDRYGALITPNTLPFITSETEVQDIDNEEDWKIAEMKYGIIGGDRNE